jgi:hypothetical protein
MSVPMAARVFALHRYFIWAAMMRAHFLERAPSYPDIRRAHLEPYMAYWYGGMYVVIEGWKALELQDPRIDELLRSQHVALLKRYRHGAFHYQAEYFDERFVALWSADSVEEWIAKLHEAFDAWFLHHDPLPTQTGNPS